MLSPMSCVRVGVFLAMAVISGPIVDAKAPEKTMLDFEKFEKGTLPTDFSTALTGGGGRVAWAIAEDSSSPSGPKVLAQTSADSTDYRFPLCTYSPLSAKDVGVAVRFKAVAGRVDQAGGLIGRFRDKDNYYVARANALEGNGNLYKGVAGKRARVCWAQGKKGARAGAKPKSQGEGQTLEVA